MSYTLCLDVGNSNIYGGIFDGNEIIVRFRHETRCQYTQDQLGIFLRSMFWHHNIKVDSLGEIGICSVVPNLDELLFHACEKYLNRKPFVLKAGVKTGLQIKAVNPLEVGSDLVATAIAALEQFPDKNLIIADFGTITSFTAISKNRELLGASFIPGPCLAMRAMSDHTAKLPIVNFVSPVASIGKTTTEAMQSGMYYGGVGASKEIVEQISKSVFPDSKPLVIATGGMGELFASEELFDYCNKDLILNGIKIALKMNSSRRLS